MNQAAEVINEVEVKESRKSTFMQRVWSKMGKDEKGFTLIELLAVLVIIAIIAVIAIPLIGNIISNSRTNADLATARQVYDASRLYITGEQNGQFTTGSGTSAVGASVSISDMQNKGYLDSPLVLPSTKATITSGTVTYTNTGSLSQVVLNTGGTAASGSTPATTGTANTFTAEKVLSQK
ncbi:prepilin-type N-terminal cleavage/methylation domain-containing protein [Saccharibacillus sacchari]|uniref:Prepilin-type N-terminal cleavage/methylation domain-containing protein n=1 Tax=Saccharibacillus sacchari TaxID=456493 RepID=A0ACC6P9Y8_9BACL